MIVKVRMLLVGATSALAIAAVFMPSEASACSATAAVRNGVNVVDVVCAPGDPAVAPFSTSYPLSDGSGTDTFTMSGSAVLATAGATPLVIGVGNLDPNAGAIDMLGGNDLVIISGGTIGSAATPIGIFLGAGADTFRMSGGTVTGSVFGQGGGNSFAVSGGTIRRFVIRRQPERRVAISGTANIQGDSRSDRTPSASKTATTGSS